MKLLIFTLFAIVTFTTTAMAAQNIAMDSLPYHDIPGYPDSFTPATVAARMIDGLGYRYYWATQDLNESDLDYKPSEDSRTIRETLQHIHGLAKTTYHAVINQPNVRPTNKEVLSLFDLRAQTLLHIKNGADVFRDNPDADLKESNIIFQRGENKSEFPFWNLLNGPLADAIYHTGQIVAFRRAAGNPLPKGVNVFTGKTRD